MIKNPIHPGEVLQADVLRPLDLSVATAATKLGVSRVTLSRIVNGRAGISPSVAIRLEMAGAGEALTWLNLQANYDLAAARLEGIDNVLPLQRRTR